jgi:hypothetical protein
VTRRRPLVGKLPTCLAAAAIASGMAGLIGEAAGTAAAAGSPSPVCGSITPLTASTSPNVTSNALTVPQYSGSDLAGVQLSLKFTHAFGPAMIVTGANPTYTDAGSGENVMVEMSGPGLPALGPYVNPAPTSNAGFTLTGTVFSAGDPAPTLPAGLVASSITDGVAVETAAGNVDPSWNALGYGSPQIVAAPWATYPQSVVTANDGAQLDTKEQTQTVSDLTDYEGTGSTSLSAAFFDNVGHSFGSGSQVAFGTNDSMSVQACATYTVLGAATPEVSSVILLPASAGVIGFGALFMVRRRAKASAA